MFKGQGVISSQTFFSLVGGRVMGSQRHHPSGFSWSAVYVLVDSIQLTSSTQGFSICKTVQRIWLKIVSIIVLGELKVLDFV